MPKLVVVPIRSISAFSWSYSVWAAVRAVESCDPALAACTERSRIRCRIECTSESAPSAVCTTEMPSWALRMATLVPPTWARRPSLIDRPAASSAARLMRKPEESFSRLFDICPSVTVRFR